jgi:signal transduction histidine kinase
MSETFDYETHLKRLVELLVPNLADWCAVVMMEESGDLKLAGMAHRDRSKIPLFDEILREYVPNPVSSRGLLFAIHGGKPVIVSSTDELHSERSEVNSRLHHRIHELGFKSYVIVPLVAHQRRLGALILGQGESARKFAPEDLGFYQEIAIRAALSLDKARLYKEAQAAIRAREEILAIVSHDLKNPLSSIALGAEMIPKISSLDDISRAQVERITRALLQSVSVMQGLVVNILDHAKIHADRLRIRREKQDTRRVLQECVETVKLAAETKSLHVTLEVDPNLPPLQFDRVRLSQVLLNLISNSIKFTPSGGRIAIRCQKTVEEALFTVVDTGPGIPPDEIPHVFDRFWSAKESSLQGTGLGLSIAKGIIEAHQGRIWVESTVGIGSTFYFTLPLLPAQTGSASRTA